MSDSHATTHHDDHGQHAHHVTPQGMLVKTFVVLLVLMVATIAAALVFKGLPYWLMWTIALAIALTKATLVVQIFMGVKWSTGLTKVFAYGGFVFFLFLYMAMVDYTTRGLEPVQGWDSKQETALPR